MADGLEEQVEADEIELELENSEVLEESEEETKAGEEDPEEDDDTIPEVEELDISIDGESHTPEDEEVSKKEAEPWVKNLRKKAREDAKTIRDLKAKVEAKEEDTETVPTLGKKPSMEDPDIEYDAEKFEAALVKYHDDKDVYDKALAKVEAKKGEDEKAWNGTLEEYGNKKTALKVKDYDEVESIVKDTLSVAQQSVILKAAENSALLVYAIGKNPKKAAELKAITDIVLFTAAVTRLETKLKVNNRKAATKPERKVTGSTSSTSTSDSTLIRLRGEAEKTGDFTKVSQYRRKQRAKKKNKGIENG